MVVVKDSVGVSGSMWASPAPQLGMLLRICLYSKNSTTTLSESNTKYLRTQEFLADYNISFCVLPERHRVGYIYILLGKLVVPVGYIGKLFARACASRPCNVFGEDQNIRCRHDRSWLHLFVTKAFRQKRISGLMGCCRRALVRM